MQEPANENELPAPAEFRIESEDVVYDRYMTIYNRRVIFPRRSGAQVAHVADAADVVDSTDSHRGHDGEEIHEFDVVGHPKANFHFVVAFPYHPPSDPDAHWSDGSVTLIREYAQGPNELIYGLPAGSYHVEMHKTLEGAAWAELSEEAHLCGGEMHRLLADSASIAEVKWCANRFTPFIVVGCGKDERPGTRDQEEFIEVERVTVRRLREIMRSGEMMLPSITTAYWAFEWLEDRWLEKQSKGSRK